MATTNNAIVPHCVYPGIQEVPPDSYTSISSSPEYLTPPDTPTRQPPSAPNEPQAPGIEPMSLFKGAKDFVINDSKYTGTLQLSKSMIR